MHIPKEIRQKIDSKSEKCIFIGYKDRVKGYKVRNPATRTIVYSRDVIFREVGSTYETKEAKREKEQENLESDLSKESHDSKGSTESEEKVELQTSVMRRSSRERK